MTRKDPNAPVAALTETEIQSLHEATTEQEWNARVKVILDARDGAYPPAWVQIAGPIMRKFG